MFLLLISYHYNIHLRTFFRLAMCKFPFHVIYYLTNLQRTFYHLAKYIHLYHLLNYLPINHGKLIRLPNDILHNRAFFLFKIILHKLNHLLILLFQSHVINLSPKIRNIFNHFYEHISRIHLLYRE